MEALRSLVSLASADDADAGSNGPAANLRKAARLTGQQPVLVAWYEAARSGKEPCEPNPGLGLAANLLLQITGTAVVAALGTLKGPLHGGASEQVMRELQAVRNSAPPDPAQAAGAQAATRWSRGEKIMGFGHRVYRTRTPGPRICAGCPRNLPLPQATTPATGCHGGWRRWCPLRSPEWQAGRRTSLSSTRK